jgi:hypothetical protein
MHLDQLYRFFIDSDTKLLCMCSEIFLLSFCSTGPWSRILFSCQTRTLEQSFLTWAKWSPTSTIGPIPKFHFTPQLPLSRPCPHALGKWILSPTFPRYFFPLIALFFFSFLQPIGFQIKFSRETNTRKEIEIFLLIFLHFLS